MVKNSPMYILVLSLCLYNVIVHRRINFFYMSPVYLPLLNPLTSLDPRFPNVSFYGLFVSIKPYVLRSFVFFDLRSQ